MSSSARSAGPLAGLRVMDVSIMAAGPWTGALLGMLGAEVIKVEPPAGDGTRWVMPTQRGMGTNYLSMNVNKKGVVIDLKTPEGRAQGMELLGTCDVFVQNFRGGVIERLGFGYDAVRAANPRLVYCAISGFGETGPLAKAGCADPIMQAFSGFARANGAPGDPVEAFRFTGFLDLTTASVATMSILAALLDRDRTGLGQKVEVSMLEAALEIQGTRLAELLGAGLRPAPMGSANPSFAPDRAYATLDHELFVSVQRPATWSAFCKAIGQDALADDPRFADNAARVAHRDALERVLPLPPGSPRGRWGMSTRADAGDPQAPTVVRVVPDSPLDRAGLRCGDRILAIDGEPVGNQETMLRRMAASGDALALEVDRAGRRMLLQVVGGGAPSAAAEPGPAR